MFLNCLLLLLCQPVVSYLSCTKVEQQRPCWKTDRVPLHKMSKNLALAGPFKASSHKSFISETLLSGKGQQTA